MKTLAVLLLLAGLLVAGCDNGVRYIPEVAGVVVALGPSGHDYAYTLENGQTVTLQGDAFLDDRMADVGQLLLTGSSPKPWAYRIIGGSTKSPLAPSSFPPVCYGLTVGPGRVGDTWVETELNLHTDPPAVLRVPKAPTFTADQSGLGDDGQMTPGDVLCLDATGRAVKYLDTPQF